MTGPATARQPAPTKSDHPDICGLVVADIRRRSHFGLEKYGEPLRAFNGRDALTDAYQEALDLAMYLRQLIDERDGAAIKNPAATRDSGRALSTQPV